MKEIKHRSDCPISFSLDILGDKWTLLILRDMIFSGKTSYSEFLRSEEKIATTVLADRLSVLYAQGLINKKIGTDKKSKFEYSLTQKGIELLPAIMEITIWGAKFSPSGGNETLLEELQKDKEGTIRKYSAILSSRAAGSSS